MREERKKQIEALMAIGHEERYALAATYLANVDPCPMCGKIHPGHIPKHLKKTKYAGIDDAGDDMEDWGWNYINGRCVISRKLKKDEYERYGVTKWKLLQTSFLIFWKQLLKGLKSYL